MERNQTERNDMVIMGNWKIFVKDENDKYEVAVRHRDTNLLARFDCQYAAKKYAESVGLKDYIVKK